MHTPHPRTNIRARLHAQVAEQKARVSAAAAPPTGSHPIRSDKLQGSPAPCMMANDYVLPFTPEQALEESKQASPNPDALVILGMCLEEGQFGFEHNPARAVDLYKRAVAAGNMHGYYALANYYYKNTHDLTESIKLYRLAANKGHRLAVLRLSEFLLHQFGSMSYAETSIMQDWNEKVVLANQMQWLASPQNFHNAYYQALYYLAHAKDDPSLHKQVFDCLAAINDPHCQETYHLYFLGKYYQYGIQALDGSWLLEPDYGKAVDVLSIAAQGSSIPIAAMQALIEIHQNGVHIPSSAPLVTLVQASSAYDRAIREVAFYHIQNAADKKDKPSYDAIYYVAQCIGKTDPKKAAAYLAAAVDRGHIRAVLDNTERASTQDAKAAADKQAIMTLRYKANIMQDAEAQQLFGTYLEMGCVVEQDKEQAFEYYRRAALQGNAKAQEDLAWCYAKGVGVSRNQQQALYWWHQAAIRHQPEAAYQLALQALKTPLDPHNQALPWLIKAADLGHTRALKKILEYCAQSPAMLENASIIACLQLAATKGNAQALKMLGPKARIFRVADFLLPTIFVKGRNSDSAQTAPADIKNLLDEISRSAAGARFHTACVQLGEKLEKFVAEQAKENLLIKDWLLHVFIRSNSDYQLWLKLANEGVSVAQYLVGYCCEGPTLLGDQKPALPQDEKQAVTWYEKASVQGFVPAITEMGLRWQFGHGISLNNERALNAYRLASSKGFAVADYLLGSCYEFGTCGLEVDINAAGRSYEKALAAGINRASLCLARLSEKGYGYDKEQQQEGAHLETALKGYEMAMGKSINLAAAMRFNLLQASQTRPEPLSDELPQAAANGDIEAIITLSSNWMYNYQASAIDDDFLRGHTWDTEVFNLYKHGKLDKRPHRHYALAMFHLTRGEHAEALNYLNRITPADNFIPAYHLYWLAIYYLEGIRKNDGSWLLEPKPETAITLLTQAIKNKVPAATKVLIAMHENSANLYAELRISKAKRQYQQTIAKSVMTTLQDLCANDNILNHDVDGTMMTYLADCAQKGQILRTVDLGYCYERAAGMGNADAIFKRARVYEKESDLFQRHLASSEWDAVAIQRYRLDATHDIHAGHAYYQLGVCYAHGYGVARDEAAAYSHFITAARYRYAKAYTELAICYETGRGVDKDLAIAESWRQRIPQPRGKILATPWPLVTPPPKPALEAQAIEPAAPPVASAATTLTNKPRKAAAAIPHAPSFIHINSKETLELRIANLKTRAQEKLAIIEAKYRELNHDCERLLRNIDNQLLNFPEEESYEHRVLQNWRSKWADNIDFNKLHALMRTLTVRNNTLAKQTTLPDILTHREAVEDTYAIANSDLQQLKFSLACTKKALAALPVPRTKKTAVLSEPSLALTEIKRTDAAAHPPIAVIAGGVPTPTEHKRTEAKHEDVKGSAAAAPAASPAAPGIVRKSPVVPTLHPSAELKNVMAHMRGLFGSADHHRKPLTTEPLKGGAAFYARHAAAVSWTPELHRPTAPSSLNPNAMHFIPTRPAPPLPPGVVLLPTARQGGYRLV